MNRYNFDKETTDKMGGTLSVKYEGVYRDLGEDRIQRADMMVRRFFDRKKDYDNMYNNVEFFRTALKEFDEVLLTLDYVKGTDNEHTIYEGGNLTSFLRKQTIDDLILKSKYVKDGSISYSFNDAGKLPIETFCDLNLRDFIDEFNNDLRDLDAVEPILLTRDDNIIIKMYYMIFDQMPDFSSSKTQDRIMKIVYLLSGFGFSFGEVSDCFTIRKNGMPYSVKLSSDINRLYSIGLVEKLSNDIKFYDSVNDRIQIFKEMLNYYTDPNKVLRKYNVDNLLLCLCKIMAAERNVLPDPNYNEKLSALSGFDSSDVSTYLSIEESVMKRTRKISNS